MTIINAPLFNISIKKSPANKAFVEIGTNGYPTIGDFRVSPLINEEYLEPRKLNLSYDKNHNLDRKEIAALDTKVFCEFRTNKLGKTNPRMTSNPNSDIFSAKDGHAGVYLIAVPFRKRISAIIVNDPRVKIYKTCFSSVTQKEPKKPFIWGPPEEIRKNKKKYEYHRTLYILAELDFHNYKGMDPAGSSIEIIESSITRDGAKDIIENASKLSDNNPIKQHHICVPLPFNASDRDNIVVSKFIDYFPTDTEVVTDVLTADETIKSAKRILGEDHLICRRNPKDKLEPIPQV